MTKSAEPELLTLVRNGMGIPVSVAAEIVVAAQRVGKRQGRREAMAEVEAKTYPGFVRAKS